jgi:hypothetical protein
MGKLCNNLIVINSVTFDGLVINMNLIPLSFFFSLIPPYRIRIKVREGCACHQWCYRTIHLDLITRHARERLHCTQAARTAIYGVFWDVLL